MTTTPEKQVGEMWFAATGPPDSRGRQRFHTYWIDWRGLRGQVSVAVIEEDRHKQQAVGVLTHVLPTPELAREAARERTVADA